MLCLIPLSLVDAIPTKIKETSAKIENSADLFLFLSQVETEQELPDFLIIRNDLINLFDRVLRELDSYALETFRLVEDSESPVVNLDMHYELLSLKDFLALVEQTTMSNVETELTTETTEEAGVHDDAEEKF